MKLAPARAPIAMSSMRQEDSEQCQRERGSRLAGTSGLVCFRGATKVESSSNLIKYVKSAVTFSQTCALHYRKVEIVGIRAVARRNVSGESGVTPGTGRKDINRKMKKDPGIQAVGLRARFILLLLLKVDKKMNNNIHIYQSITLG